MRALALSLLLAGCSAAPPGSVQLAIGTTNADGSGFLPLDGDQPLVAGAQGGFHVWLTYRVQGMAPATIVVQRTARRVSDDKLVMKTQDDVEIDAPAADGWWSLPSPVRSFMCPTPIGVQIADEPIRFEVELDLPDGTTVTGDAEATPRCPVPTDGQYQHCEQICNG
jgi:hypothetical protein